MYILYIYGASINNKNNYDYSYSNSNSDSNLHISRYMHIYCHIAQSVSFASKNTQTRINPSIPLLLSLSLALSHTHLFSSSTLNFSGAKIELSCNLKCSHIAFSIPQTAPFNRHAETKIDILRSGNKAKKQKHFKYVFVLAAFFFFL